MCISDILAWPPSVSLRLPHADNSFNVFELIFNVIFFLLVFFFSVKSRLWVCFRGSGC